MTGAHISAVPVARLRAELRRRGLDGFVVPRADEHQGEYVPASAQRLAHITGFTGSAGMAVLLLERAAVFSDGRYTLQMEAEVDRDLFETLHVTDNPPTDWITANLPEGARPFSKRYPAPTWCSLPPAWAAAPAPARPP